MTQRKEPVPEDEWVLFPPCAQTGGPGQKKMPQKGIPAGSGSEEEMSCSTLDRKGSQTLQAPQPADGLGPTDHGRPPSRVSTPGTKPSGSCLPTRPVATSSQTLPPHPPVL